MKNFCLIGLLIAAFLTALPFTCNAAINEKLLNQAGLQTIWQNAVSLDPKENIQSITILGDYLYILTNSHYLFCMDRNTGRLTFGVATTSSNLPVCEPTAYGNFAYIAAGNKLIAMDLQQGTELYRKNIPFSVSAIAVNASHFYFVGLDRRIHVMDLKCSLEVFDVSAASQSNITSLIIAGNRAFFATEVGNVISMDANSPKKYWQFDTVGAIMAPLAKNSDWLYASSKDTNLYKLNAANGSLVWKFATGSILTLHARATDNTVYQYAIDKGLYAVDANSGKQSWLLPDGVDLLAEDKNTSYIFDRNNTCIVMDNNQAKKIYTVNFAGVTSYAANPYDSKIYLMENKNISCIQPIKK